MTEIIDGFFKIVTAANNKNKAGIALTISISRIMIRSRGSFIFFEKKEMRSNPFEIKLHNNTITKNIKRLLNISFPKVPVSFATPSV